MSVNGSQMLARVLVTAEIYARSGLRIGGTLPGLAIGGVDLPVIRDPMTGYPYLPGSSLRGKMRALLDRWSGNEAKRSIGGVKIHMPENQADYDRSPVGRLFGVLPNSEIVNMRPTRLIVRDVYLDGAEAERLRKAARGGLLYTEAKTEAAIDRWTSAATPRTIERVLAGTTFRPFAASITLYEGDRVDEYLPLLLQGMRLLEDDYLGGHGSRGSGEIEFRALAITVRRRADYAFPFGEGTVIAEGKCLLDAPLNNEQLLDQLQHALAAD